MLGEARIGTSGFAERELGGQAGGPLLGRYAQLLSTVEIASSFQRPPSAEQCAAWAEIVPAGFQLALKVPRRITHDLRLGLAAQRHFAAFLDAAGELGPHLGPLLVHLPPDFAIDLRVLAEFLEPLPRELRLAFDFRHPSWRAPAAMRLLSAHEAALVVHDTGEEPARLELTAGFTYLRLEADADGASWEQRAERLAALTGRGIDVYAFVRHDRRGVAIERARRLAALLQHEESGAEQSLLT
jgi:uncharacterized protein YecE (DUF72 family)